MMPRPVISADNIGTANSRKKNMASLFGSRGSANSSSAAATMMKIQKLCARNAARVMPNHRLRRRSKSPAVDAKAQAGVLANANTTVARTRMTTRAFRCSGMVGLPRKSRLDDSRHNAIEHEEEGERD